jgi:hypothetical protein
MRQAQHLRVEVDELTGGAPRLPALQHRLDAADHRRHVAPDHAAVEHGLEQLALRAPLVARAGDEAVAEQRAYGIVVDVLEVEVPAR